MKDVRTLLNYAASQSEASAQRAAHRRLAQLIDEGATSFDAIAGQTSDWAVLLSIASMTRDVSFAARIVSGLTDPAVLFALAVDGATARVRQLAAEQLTDEAQLRSLAKVSRGKDKAVYRIAKSKCEAFAAVQKRAAEEQAHIAALCDSIERQVHKPYDGLFVTAVEHLSQQWAAVADRAPPEIAERAARAFERCHEINSSHVRDLAIKAAQKTAVENALQLRTTLLSELKKACTTLATTELAGPEARERYQRLLDSTRERWSETLAFKPADRDESTAFHQTLENFQGLLAVTSDCGTLRQQLASIESDGESASPEQLSALRQTLLLLDSDASEQLTEELAKARQFMDARTASKDAAPADAHDSSLRQLESLIRRARAAARDGRSGQAAGLRRAIEEKIVAAGSLPPRLMSQVQQLDARIAELQDWKRYAVAPKRQELTAEMESLVGADEEPAALAEHIKRLQEEWRTLSRGAPDESDAEWLRFKEAGDKAYEPCREYFKAQAEQRAANLERRRELVRELEQFEQAQDWENPHWNAVRDMLRNARQRWREYSPTDRSATRPVQEAFDDAIARLQARLDAEFAHNIERKQQLIAQAQRLTEAEDVRRAIDEVKGLQAAWKNVGIVPRAEDQKLWHAFREQCDAVYQRSQQEHANFVAGLESGKAAALVLIEELEQLASGRGEQLLAARARVDEIREAFDTIEALPRKDASAIRQRFAQSVRSFEMQLQAQRANEQVEGWIDALKAADLLRQWRIAGIEGNAEGEAAARNELGVLTGAAPRWPRGTADAIRDQLGTTPGEGANAARLRELCIEAELVADTDSPMSDQKLRRELQLQSLVQGFGHERGGSGERLQELLMQWLRVGAVSADEYAPLARRFEQCIRQAHSRQS